MNGILRLSVVLLLAGGGWWWAASRAPEEPAEPPPTAVARDLGDYVGVDACRACHAREATAWDASPHGRHGLPQATPRATVDGSIGSVWMQTYLARDAKGYHRILPRCFDLREKRWRAVRAVLAEISGPAGNRHSFSDADVSGRSFEVDCAGCHASGATLRVTGTSGQMRSSWRDLAIDCEACHGPGRAHAEAWARLEDDAPLVAIGTLPARQQTALCARCHGGPPATGDFGPDQAADFVGALEHGSAVRADGSALGQIYQHASFARSPCAVEGALTCTSCHATHGPGLKPVPQVDALCTTCHEAQVGRQHHHHDPSGPGGRCIECHMPRIFEGLLAHQRDHRIGIPLPATPYAPDACTACHTDRKKSWAAAAARRWWGAPDGATLAAIEAVHRANEGGVREREVLRRAQRHRDAHFRVAATRLLGDASPAVGDAMPEVRLAAVRVARDAADEALLRQFVQDREVRVRAAAWMALNALGASIPPGAAADLRRAAHHGRLDSELRMLLARLDLEAGRAEEAAEHLADAVAYRSTDIALWRALAKAYTEAGDVEHAAEAWSSVQRLAGPDERTRR